MTSVLPAWDVHTKRFKLGYVLTMGYVWGVMFLDRVAPMFLLFFIASDLKGEEQAGLLALGIGAAWGVGMWWSRFLTSRYSHKTVVLISIGTTFVLSGLSLLSTQWLLFVAIRTLAGFFATIAIPSITALTYANIEPHMRTRSMGFIQSCTRLFGTLIGPAITTSVYVYLGWQWALFASTLMVGSLLIPVLIHLPRLVEAPVTRQRKEYILKPGGRRNIWVSAILSAMSVAWLLTLSQLVLPILMEQWQLDAQYAGFVLSLFGLATWLGALSVPPLAEKIGRHYAVVLFAGAGGIGGLFFFFLIQLEYNGFFELLMLLSMFVAGLTLGILPLAISIIPSESVQEGGDVGRAVRMPIFVAEFFGGGVLTAFFVFLSQTLGNLPAFLSLSIVLLLSAFLGLLVATQKGKSSNGH